MSCCKTIESVLKLNSKGTKFLQAERYGKAINTFSTCLSSVKELLAAKNGEEDEAALLNLYAFSFRFLHSDGAESSSSTSFQSPILVVQEGGPTTRRSRRTSLQGQSNNNSMALLSFAILYNLAISFHLSASDPKHVEDESRRLNKALQLYQTAYQLIHSSSADSEDGNTTCTTQYLTVGVLESMALLNNLGQVYASLKMPEEAKTCFEEMLGNVLLVAHAGNNDEERHRRRSSVFQFDLFFDNAMNMTQQLQPTQGAAAA